jgi:hypothetical protein
MVNSKLNQHFSFRVPPKFTQIWYFWYANTYIIWPGLPDFSLYNIPKRGKIYQMDGNFIKQPQNIPPSSVAILSKIYPNCLLVCKCPYHLARVARFFWVQHTKTGKNIPNDHKIYQMDGNFTK